MWREVERITLQLGELPEHGPRTERKEALNQKQPTQPTGKPEVASG